MCDDKFSIFISYSDENIEDAQNFVNALKQYFPWDNVFLARNDLPNGEDFEQNLIKEIKQCVVFIPLISKKFLCSAYANQEVGFAKSLDKLIYPAQLDETAPPGFIHLLNAVDGTDIRIIRCGHMETLVVNLIEKMEASTKNIISHSSDITNFYQTDVFLKILEKRQDFDHEDMKILKMACENNDQIYSSGSGRGIAKIIQEYEKRIL